MLVEANVMGKNRSRISYGYIEGEFDDRQGKQERRIYKAKGIECLSIQEPSEESSPKEKSFPMEIFKDGKKGKVSNDART